MKQLTPLIGLINNPLQRSALLNRSRKALSMQSAGNIITIIACVFPLVGMLWSFKDTVPFGAWILFAIVGWIMAAVGGALQAIGARQQG